MYDEIKKITNKYFDKYNLKNNIPDNRRALLEPICREILFDISLKIFNSYIYDTKVNFCKTEIKIIIDWEIDEIIIEIFDEIYKKTTIKKKRNL